MHGGRHMSAPFPAMISRRDGHSVSNAGVSVSGPSPYGYSAESAEKHAIYYLMYSLDWCHFFGHLSSALIHRA